MSRSATVRVDTNQKMEPVELLRLSSSLRLEDWLELSWFYPEGFTPEERVETADSYTIRGGDLEYKFYKREAIRGTSAHEAFLSRYRQALLEFSDNRELGHPRYLGLRIVHWKDDEPEWRSLFLSDPQPDLVDGDEVALVAYRVPEEALLANRLINEEEISRKTIQSIVKILSQFHENRKREALERFEQFPDESLDIIMQGFLEFPREIASRFGSYLDPFTRTSLQILSSFLSEQAGSLEKTLFQRGIQGFLVDTHGAVTARNIALFLRQDEKSGPIILERAERQAPFRFADRLSDVASLVVDLLLLGFPEVADTFQTEYSIRNPEVWNESIFRAYVVSRAVERASLEFTSEQEDGFTRAAKYLAIGLKFALYLERGGMVLLSKGDESSRNDIAEGVSSLLSFPAILSPDSSNKVLSSDVFANLQIEKTFPVVREALQYGEVAVLKATHFSPDDLARLESLAQDRNVPLLNVHTRPVTEQKPEAHAGELSGFSAREPGSRSRALFLEASLSRPELGLCVLEELSRIARS